MSLRLGFRRRIPKGEKLDVAIIGGGPAGLSAALYSARFLLKTAVLTENVGGQLLNTDYVDDYPGLGKIRATDLISKFRSHAERLFNVPIYDGIKVDKIEKVDDTWFRLRGNGVDIYAKAIILAIGSLRRRLGVPGEKEYSGHGVSYCSICDAPFFRGKNSVVVVGGGDSALEGALVLSGYVKKVYLVHRRREFRAKPFYVELVRSKNNIEFLLDTVVKKIKGDSNKVTSVVVENKATKERKELKIDGIFIEIGFEPPKEWFKKIGLKTDERGYLKVDEWMRTNIEGIFAAGDCTNVWIGFRQIITASAMGAVAAYAVYNHLIEKGLYKPNKTVISTKERNG